MAPTVADRIVQVLLAHGVQTVHGIPGVHNLALFEALDRSPIRVVVVRHEASAAYAADAHGRLTGRPGVCLTTSGPGAANAVAAMGEAQASRSPMLHLTTTVARRHLGAGPSRGVLHEHPEQEALFAPVTKLTRHVAESGAVAGAVDEALGAAAAAPAAPAYVEIPTDVLGEPAPEPHAGGPPARPPAPGRPELRALAARLEAARRPLVWVGSGAAGQAGPILALARRLGAPVVLTHSAKRAWAGGGDPLVPGHPPHEPAVTALCAQADAVLVLGSDLDGMMTQEFRLPLAGVLRIDVDPLRLQVPYPAEVAVLGDAGQVVGGLLALVAETDREGWGPGAVAHADAQAAAALAGEDDAAPGLAFVGALDAALGDREAVVVCDMAIAAYWTAAYLPLAPTRRILYPMGWGTLGFALPAAIGAACAGGGRVVVVCGDGGVLFAVGELATLAQEGLDVTVVVSSDGGYGMLRYDQERAFGRTFAVDLRPPDLPAVARGFGLPAHRIGLGEAGLAGALAQGLDVTGPCLVEVAGAMTPPRTTSPRWPLRG
ncbi:thiamine pyrophosphate-binding protein [Baekduia soli]|uniref:Thiamine pyrophosphate-binding protein n=1 Tax=Baekduia soli TaxID=496014 RepID=A0A5B8U384_9ACTN|nr:thiamine pyrophosphate-binding protein [Baekduia soli]QEC47402.1 thiamine pyrophosphate-binding protein [Baekduia soli]